ncbi:MAG: hypothetical protein HDT39_04545 [Lachnospiraceae bacterium]|nr:hypothetical protein [Lachnospiraceae bacterium]
MEICQYEFQFQNEFMGIIEKRIGGLLDVSINQENMIRIDKEQQSFILRRKDSENFMLFSANQASYVYLLIVRCEKKYEEDLRHILLEICDDIEEDYGEDHRREVRDVVLEKSNRFSKLEEKYKISKMFNIK